MDYWCGLYDWLVARVKSGGFIGPEDLDFLQIVEDADGAAEILLRQNNKNGNKGVANR